MQGTGQRQVVAFWNETSNHVNIRHVCKDSATEELQIFFKVVCIFIAWSPWSIWPCKHMQSKVQDEIFILNGHIRTETVCSLIRKTWRTVSQAARETWTCISVSIGWLQKHRAQLGFSMLTKKGLKKRSQMLKSLFPNLLQYYIFIFHIFSIKVCS